MKDRARNLIITVKEIKGNYPVYGTGDKIVINEGYKLNLQEAKALCMHSLASLMPFYVALSRGISSKDLVLAKKGEKAYIQCLDPCRYTGGRTVIFEVETQ